MPGPINHAALNRLSEDALARGALPQQQLRVGDRVAVAVTVCEPYGAVLWLGPRSSGGLQYHCVRARRRDGRWALYDTDSDEWPRRDLNDRPRAGTAPPIVVAGSVAERQGGTLLVVVAGVAAASVEAVVAELDGTRDVFAVEPATGAFVAVVFSTRSATRLILSIEDGHAVELPV